MIRRTGPLASLLGLTLLGAGAVAESARPVADVFQMPRLAAELRQAGEAVDAPAGLAPLARPLRIDCPADPEEALAPAEPALVRQNEAPVEAASTAWDVERQRLVSRFVFPPILKRKPVAAPGAWPEPVLRELRRLVAQGRGAGLAGVVYDNRDRGHSALAPDAWPQLGFTRYAPAARAADLDYGLNTALLFDAVTFGNSSTAVTGSPQWRSQPRLGLTTPEGAARLYQLYAHDHLYVFPEHQDHDADRHGDVFPANTPYYLVSQGSSGSDRPFLAAVAAILAAMKPEVRDVLDRHDLVAPTVQMAFRQGLRSIGTAEDYMSAAAHPTVFRANDIDLPRMIRVAHALEAGTVPPMPCLRVLRQTHPRPGQDYFVDTLPELLFDTPSAIARVWRGAGPERRLVLDAGGTRDPNGRSLRFHWRLLRGDPERVRIEPLDETGSRAGIVVGWHERAQMTGPGGIGSDRVDIAVFADNGAALSAPAFFSMAFPADQLRRYENGPDGRVRIAEIDYAAEERRDRYVDPLLFPARDWRDSYAYDDTGRLTGWTRRRGAEEERFTRNGLRVLELDAEGRPARAEEMAYPVESGRGGRPRVVPAPTGRVFAYVYAGEEDRLGVPVLEGGTVGQ